MRELLTTVALFFCLIGFSQKFTLDTGVGIGGVLEEQTSAGRAVLFVAGMYHPSDSYAVGIDLGTGGNWLPVDGIEMISPTEERISPYGARFNHVLLKGVYYRSWGIGSPYVAIGAGINSYRFYVHTVDTDLVSRNNFIGMLEVGIQFENRLTTSFRYYSPGKTPDFSGIDQNGVTKVLEETSFSMLLLTLGYSFEL